jgi:outer membrane protein assembly factor BamB/predicted phosphodiesterase
MRSYKNHFRRIIYFPQMKWLSILLFVTTFAHAQSKPFRFAFISDTHIGSPNGGAEEDLRRTVADINSMNDISFVVITGDITELGKRSEILLAKEILDSLRVPYYIIPGNHDTGWSESGGLDFTKIFGSDRFFFNYAGIHFIGCASGPYVRMSDGHVPRSAMNWMKEKLKTLKSDEPVIFLNHYPLDNGLDNWYEVIDLLKTKNTILALCGHGHNNRPVQAEDIPSVMGRSNLRAKAPEGGYNLVDIRSDSILFTERKPLTATEKQWTGVKNELHRYDMQKKFARPDFSLNERSPAKAKWTYSSTANIISTPVVADGLVIVGNQDGVVEAVDIQHGKRKWSYHTKGPIFSSPAASSGIVVVGSSDGNIYALNTVSGKSKWQQKTGASVLGSPLIVHDTIFIGGSDHSFRALALKTGKVLWSFNGIEGPVVSRPVVNGGTVVFGAWDKYLYAVERSTGHLLWKWNNGSSVINYAPAACIPVVKDDAVYIAAPDRYLTAIDIKTGQTLWRTNEAAVRESIGISADGDLVYGKTMQDTVVAFRTQKDRPIVAWKLNAGYGYEHAPSMLIEKEGKVFFGTRNGVVYALDPAKQQIIWAFKIDNSMVNTVNPISASQVIASTMDGKLCLIEAQ